MQTKKIKNLFWVLAFSCVSSASHSSEGGVGTWAIGVNTVLNGLYSEPGQQRFYNYTQYYTSSKTLDNEGRQRFKDFDLETFVNSFRFDRGWAKLGNYALSSGITIPLVYNSVDAHGHSDTITRQGNIILKTLILGAKSSDGTFIYNIAPLDFNLPTGSYDSDQLANAGVNYYTWQPNFNYSWFPRKDIEVSGTASATFSTENKDTNYQSGNVFQYEQLIGYNINQKVQVGLQGYYLQQFTDDDSEVATLPGGNRGRALALGPQLRYTYAPGSAIAVKYQKEFSVKNRAEGDRIWVQFSFPF